MPWKAHALFTVTSGTSKGDNLYSQFTLAIGANTVLYDEMMMYGI